MENLTPNQQLLRKNKTYKVKDYKIENMSPKFQVDWTSTSSKTTSTKNFNQSFNLKRDRQTEGQTDGRTNQWMDR